MRDIMDTLKKDVEIPDIVNERAEAAFKRVYEECEKGKTPQNAPDGNGPKVKKIHTKRMTVLAAAVVTLCAVTAGAAVIRWSHSLSQGLQASEEQMKALETSGMNKFVEQPCTSNGVTVTAVQSITDSY